MCPRKVISKMVTQRKRQAWRACEPLAGIHTARVQLLGVGGGYLGRLPSRKEAEAAKVVASNMAAARSVAVRRGIVRDCQKIVRAGSAVQVRVCVFCR